MTELTVLTWLWAQPKGRTRYEAAHVNIWADMVRRHLSMPHRLACVTDMPAGIDPSVEIIPLPTEFADVRIPTWAEERPQCFRRLALFRPDAGRVFGDRFVSMDLDCVVSGPLDRLFLTDAPFKICRGTTPGRPYNGSMMLLQAGARPQVYQRFSPAGARDAGRQFIGSDQAWISHCLGGREATWGPEDGVRFWTGPMQASAPAALVFFPGLPKPSDAAAADLCPFVVRHYRRSPQPRRALLLGFSPSVWREAAAALEEARFDAVIASPEASEHWPGPLLAIAADDAAADRLAAMHGFGDVVFCGRSASSAA